MTTNSSTTKSQVSNTRANPPRRSVAWWKLLLGVAAAAAILVLGVVLAAPIRALADRTLALAGNGSHEHETDEEWWTCGMHPWVVQPSPDGGCPICGMDLVPLDPAKFSGELTIDPAMVQNIGVRISEVTSGPLLQEVRTVGSVEVDETRLADVTTRFSGFIEELFVDETGERVEAGDPLFSVYSPELYAAADEYRLAAANAEGGDVAGGVQQDIVAAAKRRLQLLGLSEDEIKRLSDEEGQTIIIRSPVSGVVLDKTAVAGMRIEMGMRMYRIADLSNLYVQAAVYEDDFPLIELGMRATITLPNLPVETGEDFEGEVTFISPTLDAMTRQGRVRIELPNEDGQVKPGMFADVTLRLQSSDNVTLVPREAVIETGRRSVVMVSLGNGRFEPRDVTLGRDAASQRVEVLDGLVPGEKVVTSGQFLLDSEARRRSALAKMLAPTADESATAAPVAPVETVALPASAAGPMNDVLTAYLFIFDQLANDSTDGIGAQAEALADAAARLAPETPSLDVEALTDAARSLGEAKDIAAARVAFASVSNGLVPLMKETGVPATFPGNALETMKCPMYPAGQTSPWLQPVGDVRNPYMGAAMLGCHDPSSRVVLPQTPVLPTAEGAD